MSGPGNEPPDDAVKDPVDDPGSEGTAVPRERSAVATPVLVFLCVVPALLGLGALLTHRLSPDLRSTEELLARLEAPEEPGRRRAAAEALWRRAHNLGDRPAALERLTAVLGDGDPVVRATVARALGTIGPDADAGAVAAAREALRAAAEDPDPVVRSAAGQALSALSRPPSP